MKSGKSYLLTCLLLLLSGIVVSQTDLKSLDKVYGLDPLLYNGIKYTYFLPPGTGGNQYLQSPDFYVGSVTIKDETFKGITLNYDVYNQKLLLQYADEQGAFNIIEVSQAWLKDFHLEEMYFTFMDMGDGLKFYQLLGQGDIKLVYYWYKNLKLDIGTGSKDFTFTPAMRSSFILKNEKLHAFRSKKSFINIVGKEHNRDIKKYMRKNRIRLKKASDEAMTDLLNFINDL
jgi:hypothetical protein